MIPARFPSTALILLGLALAACQGGPQPAGSTLFQSLDPEKSGISFRNDLHYTESFNPYTYRNFFNGGGVAIGDLNNDGLADLYFCGNLVDNRLYLNRGEFEFEDITAYAGVACAGIWSSGVALADINGDGWLDIYVCKSGAPEGDNRHNELFLNNADPDAEGRVTFREEARQWGLANLGLSTHAAFFDYDRDGDLDCYLLNNSLRSVGGYDLIEDQRLVRDSLGGNKLFRHDGDHFTDVSEEAGIYGSAIGFGLGVTIGDVNQDGWPDMYVSNDFFERDYLYLNQQDGTFREELPGRIRELSLSSMGADLGDLNNDGAPEIFVTDMLPQGNARMKTKTAFEDWDKYQLNVRQGYHHQFIRNVLQLNDGQGNFSEIGRMTGVNATDWSWGALMFDFDNDGYRDIFVANGIYKDLTDQDYIKYYASPYAIVKKLKEEKAVIQDLVDQIPSEAVPNYAFLNRGRTDSPGSSWVPLFDNQAKELGLGQASFSNGSAYGDLDNDGDPDLVVNNVNMPPFLYRNRAETLYPARHWVKLELKGEGMNRFAVGAQVWVHAGGNVIFQEAHPMRGFQSCVDAKLTIGLGEVGIIDSLRIRWPDGRITRAFDPGVDQRLTFEQAKAVTDTSFSATMTAPVPGPFRLSGMKPLIGYQHMENEYNDFLRDRLLFHMFSAEGPAVAWADVNGDGREDVFLGGAKGQPGELWMQQANGFFQLRQSFEADRAGEDVAAVFFDANGDKLPDLYVGRGSNEFSANSLDLLDKLYVNRGNGRFEASAQTFSYQGNFINTGCVAAADIDGDGDEDLFVGERLRPTLYGVPANGYLLINDGKGQFSFEQEALAPGLSKRGMFTDASWADIDADGDPDLITAEDWGPVQIWKNNGGKLEAMKTGLEALPGWWNEVEVADVNLDGRPDLVMGNHGLNSRFHADATHPMSLVVNDFDGNGSPEQFISVFEGDSAYPLVLRQDLVRQVPALSRKFPSYASFQYAGMEDIFPAQQIAGSVKREATELRSGVAIQQADGSFRWEPLPLAAQISPVFAIALRDLNGDQLPDLILGGNLSRARPEVGIHQASQGHIFLQTRSGQWQLYHEPAFRLQGDIRAFHWLEGSATGSQLLVFRNNDRPQTFVLEQQPQ